ncbi:MAG: flagellar motor protein MotB [Caulobacterales bacterium]
MAAPNQAPIVIKKVKKVVGGGHHGGAWKVAYADFVTAMMAFFLLMWLINTTSPEQKRGIADFFAPASVSESNSGAGGLLAGQAMDDDSARQRVENPNQPQQDPGEQGSDVSASGEMLPSQDALAQARAMREDAAFDRAELAIRQAMADMPDIAELSRQIIFDNTPEGLRIQLIDQEGRSMFEPGSTEANERARRLLNTVAGVIAQLPNRITISGHTDASQAPGGVSNWEISASRANASRRILERSGVPGDQVYQVSGRADAEPLFPDDPTQPGNRRIAITLLREEPPLPSNHQL